MSTPLISAAVISIFGILGYLIYIAFEIRKKQEKHHSDELYLDLNHKAVSDDPLYKATKQTIAALRQAIDEYREHVDRLFTSIPGQLKEDVKVSYKDESLGMLRSLREARGLAKELLISVTGEPEQKIETLEISSETTDVPPIENMEAAKDAIEIVKTVKSKVERVGLCISSFYMALTIEDEGIRNSEAAEQAATAVLALDDAISELVKVSYKQAK